MNSNTVFITDNQRKYAEAEMEAFEWVKRKGAGGLRGREREGRVERERRETRDGWTDSSGLSRWSGLFGSSGLFSDPADQTDQTDRRDQTDQMNQMNHDRDGVSSQCQPTCCSAW